MKKWISLLLICALMATTCLCAFPLTASAEDPTTQQWLDFEAIELNQVATEGWMRYGDGSSTADSKNFVTTSTTYINGKGYAVIRKFVAPKSGTLRFDTAVWSSEANAMVDSVGISGGNQYTGDMSVGYAITDGNGKILYPYDGKLGSTSYNNPTEPISKDDPFIYPVEEGDVLNFVLINQRPDGGDMPANFNGRVSIYNIIDGVYSETPYSSSVLCPMAGYGAQGEGGWYYQYATSVNVMNYDPSGSTDLGKEMYSASYTLNPLVYDETSGNTGAWKDPNGAILAAYGNYAYPTIDRDVVCRFTAPSDGDYSVSYCVIKLLEGAAGTADFFIADMNGDIIWPEYGGPFHMEVGNLDKQQNVFPFKKLNMKQGEYFDFVFCNRGAGSYGGMWLHGAATFNGSTEGVREGSGGFFNRDNSGAINTTLYYTDDLTVTKEINSAWSNFAISEQALNTAPATVEAWVKVPSAVADDKTGIIISDMATGKQNGFTVMMAENGAPAMLLDGGEVSMKVTDVDLRTGTWQHIAFTRDVNENTLKFYLNGELKATSYAAGTGATSGESFVIGNDNLLTSAAAFQGEMRGLALYSDARTPEEITADMANISASTEGLIGYYKLAGSNNGVYTDSSASANNCVATNVGSAWYNGELADSADDEEVLIHIGDTQMISAYYTGRLSQITQWIADNKDRLNLKYVVQTGDLVNYAQDEKQWIDAKAATDIFDANNIPYMLTMGNHEFPSSGSGNRDSSYFNKYYPFSQYSSGISGYYQEGSMENVYTYVTIAGVEYMFLSLENEPKAEVVEWAKTVVANNPTKKVVVSTHSYIQADSTFIKWASCHPADQRGYSGEQLYNEFISQYANITMVLCGHVASNDISTRVDIGVNGNKITTIMNDPSYAGEGGAGNLGIYRFKADGTVKVEYYSPLKQSFYGVNNQFTLNLNSVETAYDISSFEEMEYRESNVWFKTGWSLPYAANTYFNTCGRYNVAYKYVAQQDGNQFILYVNNLWSTEENAIYLMVLKGDGTPVYSTDGNLKTILPAGQENKAAIQFNMSGLNAGESFYIVFNSVDEENTVNHTGYFSYYSAIGANANGNKTGVQGENGYYFLTGLSDQMVPTTPSYNVITEKSLNGGTVTSTSGATVSKGGTSVINIKPNFGYKIGAVWVNGEYAGKISKFTITNADGDYDIKVIFEAIVSNDINGDGVVDIADTVAAYDYSKLNSTTDLCGTAGDMNNDRKITIEDIKSLKKKILGITTTVTDYSEQIENGVLKLSDCGVEANSPFDSSTRIQNALLTVAANPGTELEFDTGVYYVSRGSESEHHVFDLSGVDVDGLKINGNGATIMMMDNFVGCFNLSGCDNVVIENLNFECAETPWVQGTVTAYDVDNRVMTLTLDADYTVLDDARMAERMETVTGMVRDKNNPYLLKAECNNFFKIDSYQKVADRQYTVNLSKQTNYLTNRFIEEGDKIIINNRGGHTDFVFDAIGAGAITLNNINIYSTAGGGIAGSHLTGELKISNFRMTLKEGSDNWICANSDGVHIQGSRYPVTVENCEFSYLGDDAMNLYQWYSEAVNVTAANQLEIITNGTKYLVGDAVEIISKATGEILGVTTVTAVNTLAGGNLRLTLADNIQGLKIGETIDTYYVFSLENNFEGSSVKNTTFSNIRGRGMLLRTSGMTVSNNTFENISNHALEAWFNGDEGFEIRNFTFSGNTINNVSYIDVDATNIETSGAISISIFCDDKVQSTAISHDTIVIDNNNFTDYHGSAVNIGNAKNITITNNTFAVVTPSKDYEVETALNFKYCDGINVIGNTFNDARDTVTAAIRYDLDTVSNITIGTNTYTCAPNKQVVTY